jgi:hypothetical protein
MDARRTWAAPPGTRSAAAPGRSHLDAVRARWRMLTAQLRRSAVAESVAERATPALARSAVVADTSQLEIKGRRYEHGLYFLLRGSFLANLFT